MSGKPVVLDWETLPIAPRPQYPPEPIGLAHLAPGKKAGYMAFGHCSGGNTSSWVEVRDFLKKLWASNKEMLFHNAKFDLAVCYERFDLPELPWERVHDTLPLLFLDNPRAPNFALKPSAQRLLNEPPEEQDRVMDWLIARQPIPDKRLGRAKGKNYAGAYLAWAPAALVGAYAIGDVVRTQALFEKLMPAIQERGMANAYRRERRLLPVIMDMERTGVRVDEQRLRQDVAAYSAQGVSLDLWLVKRLKADINLDSDDELTTALASQHLADPELLGYTKTGKLQANKDALARGVTDLQVGSVLRYRAALNTCLHTFMEPWLLVAEQSNSLIYTTWHTTRNADGSYGTKTGRLSSTPNFQNIPNEFAPLWHSEQKGLPKPPFELLPLPQVRSYVVPYAKGDVIVDRDWSQQEPRIAAHYEEGPLLQMYMEDPWADVHDKTMEKVVAATGREYKRKPIKNTGLGILYGMGAGKLAIKNQMTVDDAAALKKTIGQLIYPGITGKDGMYSKMRKRAALNEPIYTWGGREYYCEPSKLVNGRLQQYDYKLVNLLIQGSAADCTKEAMIQLYEALKVQFPLARLILQVHDELMVSCPVKQLKAVMELVRQIMEGIELDVPLLSEGSWSQTNWAGMTNYDKKGVIL